MLDPLFTLASQNQRLTENTQRSSDAVRTQALKEGKEKGRRGSVDSTELSSDMNEMGDDLMGSMDPDLFGKSGSASLFKKLWEETVEGEEEEEEEEEGGSGGGEDRRDDGSQEAPLLEPPPPEAAPEVAGQRLEVPPPTSVAPEAAREPSKGEPPRPERAAPDQPRPEPSPARHVAPPGSGEAAVREAAEAAAPLTLGGGSLLDFSEGFLLHEATVEFEAPEAPPAPEQAPLPAELEAVLGVLMQGDSRSPAWQRLQRLLGRFGVGILGTCANQKVRVCLLPRGGLRTHPVVRNAVGAARPSGGAYLPETRTCLVEEEALLDAPRGFHPALFYMAQAWDHALGGEDFASVQSAAVKASYDACRRSLQGHAFPDGMAAESPVHYFAQAVEAYLSENDCADPLWTREDLYDFDRSMYSYVEYLLKQGNLGR